MPAGRLIDGAPVTAHSDEVSSPCSSVAVADRPGRRVGGRQRELGVAQHAGQRLPAAAVSAVCRSCRYSCESTPPRQLRRSSPKISSENRDSSSSSARLKASSSVPVARVLARPGAQVGRQLARRTRPAAPANSASSNGPEVAARVSARLAAGLPRSRSATASNTRGDLGRSCRPGASIAEPATGQRRPVGLRRAGTAGRPDSTANSAAASATVRAIGPAVSCRELIGTMPAPGHPAQGRLEARPRRTPRPARRSSRRSRCRPPAGPGRPRSPPPSPTRSPRCCGPDRAGCGSGRRPRSSRWWRRSSGSWPTRTGWWRPAPPARRRAAARPAGRRRPAASRAAPGSRPCRAARRPRCCP